MRPSNVVSGYQFLGDTYSIKPFTIKVYIKLPAVASLTQGDVKDYLGAGTLCSAVF